jgi:hypothetical protein
MVPNPMKKLSCPHCGHEVIDASADAAESALISHCAESHPDKTSAELNDIDSDEAARKL